MTSGGSRALRRREDLKRNGLIRFNARDVRRHIGGALREPAAMRAACKVLIDGGLIRPAFTRAGETSGRHAQNYDVNPVVLDRAS
jgi:hypothetical protein